MSKNLSAFTFVYTSDRIDACGVRMYTDKSSEVCTLRFGNSFTLPVVTPQDLIDFAHEILSFARDAHDFHYPELLEDETPAVKSIPAAMSELQKKLEDCGVVEPFDPSDEVAREAYEEMGGISRASVQGIDRVPAEPYVPVEQEPSKVGKMMMGTVSAPEWNPNDPINW